jgi:hypothetical protein
MRQVVLTAVKILIRVFWVVPCDLYVGANVSEEDNPEDGVSMFLRNAGTYLQAHIAKKKGIS